MNTPLVTSHLTKTFGTRPALSDLTLSLPGGRIAGLLGRNGSGKSTLINIACGLLLPTAGNVSTFDTPVADLDTPQLSRLGVVFQEGKFLDWMSVERQVAFHASFYPTWDKAREARLFKELDLDPTRKIGQLSPGDRQKLGIILGVCHHPSLLLLDEPISSLDPVARSRMLAFLLDLIREDECTVVISSHILADVEKIIDWVICLEKGRLTTSSAYDVLQESYAEWVVTSASGTIPNRFAEPWILTQRGDSRVARLSVRDPGALATEAFATRYGLAIEKHYLNLEQLFPLLIEISREAA